MGPNEERRSTMTASPPRPRSFALSAGSVLQVLLLAACGGGSVGYPPDPPPATARPGAADIGTAGGTVDAVLEGGTAVSLSVPAGALASTTSFRLDPLPAPAGSQGAVRLTPVAIALRQPAILTIALAGTAPVDADLRLFLEAAGRRVPLGGRIDPATRRIVATLEFLGPSSVAPPAQLSVGRARPALSGSESADLVIARANFAELLDVVAVLVNALDQAGSFDNAIAVHYGMSSILNFAEADGSARLRGLVTTWKRVVCGQQEFAVSSLNTFNGVDVATFRQRAADAIDWVHLARELGQTVARFAAPQESGCASVPGSNVEAVEGRLPAFLEAVRAALDLIHVDTHGDDGPFKQVLNIRIPELIKLEEFLQLHGIGASTANLITDQISRLRDAAYKECRADAVQGRQALLLEMLFGNAAFVAASPFTVGNLHTDIQFCGMRMLLERIDANDTAIDSLEVGGVGSPPSQQTRVSATVSLADTAKVRIQQFILPLRALGCPVGSQNNEQLVFEGGPPGGALETLARLTPSNANTYLETPLFLDFSVTQLLALRPPGTPAEVRLVIRREGGLCNGEFLGLTQHATLADLTLVVPSLQLTGNYTGTFSSTITTASGQLVPANVPVNLALTQTQDTITGTYEVMLFNGPRGTVSGTVSGQQVVSLTLAQSSLCPGSFTGSATVDAATRRFVASYAGTDCLGVHANGVADVSPGSLGMKDFNGAWIDMGGDIENANLVWKVRQVGSQNLCDVSGEIGPAEWRKGTVRVCGPLRGHRE